MPPCAAFAVSFGTLTPTVGIGTTGTLGAGTVGSGTLAGSGTEEGSGLLVLRTGGLTAVRPRFESPRTERTFRRAGTLARLAGAKNVEPSGALNVFSVVPNALLTCAAEPSSRTSMRFAETEETFRSFAFAHARTALTVAVVGA